MLKCLFQDETGKISYTPESDSWQRPFKSFQMFDYVKQFQSERFWWLMLISGKNISFRNYVRIVSLNHLKVVITIMLPVVQGIGSSITVESNQRLFCICH
jgi:hypothetical protein